MDAFERSAVRRVSGRRLHSTGGAVERSSLRILRDLEHHGRVLQHVRGVGVELDVAVHHARRELAAHDRRGAAGGRPVIGDQQIGRAHLSDRGQRGAERVLDAASPAALVDDGDLERVRAGGVAEDEAGVPSVSRLRRDRRLHRAIDLAVNQSSLVVDEAVGEREPARRDSPERSISAAIRMRSLSLAGSRRV